MATIAPDYNFLENLQKIANNPNLMVGSFKKIYPTEVTTYAATTLVKIFAIATALFGALAIVYPNSRDANWLGGFSLVGFGASIFFGKETTTVPGYKEQIKEVDELLDPCLDGMRRVIFAKAQYIYDKVNGKEVDSGDKDAVKAAMQKIAEEYDSSTPEATCIRNAALLLHQVQIDETSSKVSEYALRKFRRLEKIMEIFLKGLEGWHNHDAYLEYDDLPRRRVVHKVAEPGIYNLSVMNPSEQYRLRERMLLSHSF